MAARRYSLGIADHTRHVYGPAFRAVDAGPAPPTSHSHGHHTPTPQAKSEACPRAWTGRKPAPEGLSMHDPHAHDGGASAALAMALQSFEAEQHHHHHGDHQQ